MKRKIGKVLGVMIAFGLLALFLVKAFVPEDALAQLERNGMFFNSNCATFTPNPNFGPAPVGTLLCFDTTKFTLTYWTGSAFTGQPASSCTGLVTISAGVGSTAPACLNGATNVECSIYQQSTPVAGQLPACGMSTSSPFGVLNIALASAAASTVISFRRLQ